LISVIQWYVKLLFMDLLLEVSVINWLFFSPSFQAHTPYPCGDPYFGSSIVAYGPQAIVSFLNYTL